MEITDPSELKNKGGMSFFEFYLELAGHGKGCKEDSWGGFPVKIHFPSSVTIGYPKTIRGFYSILYKWSSENSFHQVRLWDLIEYVCKKDTNLKLNISEIPDILAQDVRTLTVEDL